MAAERYVVNGYGICKITIDGSDYFFDVIKYHFIPKEDIQRDSNIFGRILNKVVGYYLEFGMVLGELIPNANVTPNITKKGANMYDFINKYHAYNDDEKVFTLIPFYSTDADFSEYNNRTSFQVIAKEVPRIFPYKDNNRKLGNVLSIKALVQERLDIDEYQYFYRNTVDGTWVNVGGVEDWYIKDGGAEEQLIFKDSGSDEDAQFRTE